MEIEELFDEFATLIGRALARRWLATNSDDGENKKNIHPKPNCTGENAQNGSKRDGANSSTPGPIPHGLSEGFSLADRPA